MIVLVPTANPADVCSVPFSVLITSCCDGADAFVDAVSRNVTMMLPGSNIRFVMRVGLMLYGGADKYDCTSVVAYPIRNELLPIRL